jgi:hypothetical protein
MPYLVEGKVVKESLKICKIVPRFLSESAKVQR